MDCSDGGTAELSASEVMSGERVTLKITPKDESYTPIVTYNGETLAETEKNIYVFDYIIDFYINQIKTIRGRRINRQPRFTLIQQTIFFYFTKYAPSTGITAPFR